MVTLVPKITHPITIKDFRPIACCSILYKIVSKILSGKLKKVIDRVVGRSQSVFIQERFIANNKSFKS